tara:strand:- start:4940 stop:5218 length:279 start_codon:yes stop_codon:yes gene_type:complete
MIIEIIIGIVVVGLFGFLYYRQDRTIREQIDYIDLLEQSLLRNLERIKSTYTVMKELDSKGGFQGDDEIGTVFKEIESEIEKLNSDLEEINE